MAFAKLVNNWLLYAPRLMRIADEWIYNPTEKQLINAGYLPIIETEPPETDAQHYAVPRWTEENGQILQAWEIINTPESDEATESDYINALSSVGVSV